MSVIYILWLREVRHYVRSPVQIVTALGQPLVYLLALGFGLGPVFQKAGQGNYLRFVAPGVIGMSVLFTSVFSGVSLLWDRQFGFLKETLVAPVPRVQIMVGRVLGGATIAMLQGAIVLGTCLLAGFRPVPATALPEAALFMGLIATVFALLGAAIGSKLQDMQGFQAIINFLVMPIFFLSGALFPLTDLPMPLSIMTRFDPLTYGIDGLRGAFLGESLFGVVVDASVLCIVASIFLVLAAAAFSKIQV